MGNIFSYAVSEQGRVIMGRLHPGTELIPGIIALCEDAGVKSGYVSSLIGSVSSAAYVVVKSDHAGKMGITYSDPHEPPGPFEIMSAQGMIGIGEDGRLSVHLHALFCNTAGTFIGGHVLDYGNPVLATVEIAIGEAREIKLYRGFDEETGFPLFSFAQK